MSRRHSRRSPKSRLLLKAEMLEGRWVPSQTPMGPLVQRYTSTEVMALIRSQDPMSELQNWSAAGLNAAASKVIFYSNDSALVEVHLTRGTDPLAAVTALAAQPNVAWAEPNYIYIGDPREFVPNDPQYSSQYHHAKMQNDKAWDVQTGNPAIVVAILDDGMSTAHPDLVPSTWTNSKEIAGNSIDDDGNGYVDDLIGWDINSNDNNVNPLGSQTHGTHVAGIAAARTNNATGVAGIAGGGINGDGVRLMPVRWYNGSTWTASMVSQSYTYAANNGARIANASYNFDGWVSAGVPNATVNAALDYAYSKGLLLFNSAGNSNALDPARGVFDQVLFVSSSDSGDVKSSFSNYGQYVDIDAPGSSIFSTTTSTDGTVFTYGTMSGTSMSTPAAAGAAALMWSHHPTWNRDQVAAQLLSTTDNIDAANPTYIGALGTGRANTYRALTESLPAPKLGAVVGLPANNGFTATMPTSFYVNALMRFDPATVSGAKFELRNDGVDNMFDTADDVIIPMTLNNGNAYKIGVGRLSFSINGPVGPERYRFKASAALLDPFGQALDGNSDGTGGDDYIRTFTVTSPPRVSQTKIDDGTAQRSVVRSVTATFDQVVSLPAIPTNAFTLIGPNGPVTLAVDTSGSTLTQTIAKLTFSGPNTEYSSIKDGNYTFTVLSAQVQNSTGQLLDGDNNGTAGGNAVVLVHRLFGDIDGDKSVAANDFIQFRLAFGGTGAGFDFDNDGSVSASDFIQFRLRFGASI